MGKKLNNRKSTGPNSAHNQKLRKRREAEERQAERNKRNAIEQLNLLADRPGNSARERNRLLVEVA